MIRPLISIVVVAFAATASAQTRSYSSGTQVNGLFGSNTLGGNSSTSTGQSVSTGNRLTGSAQANVATTNTNVAESAIANTRQQTQGAFVGADSADTGNFLSRQTTTAGGATNFGARSGQGGLSGLSQLQSLFQQNQQGFNGQNQSQSMPQIRVALRLGFRPQPTSTTRLQKFESRLTSLPGMRFVGSPEVLMEGRTAVLRGTVASEDDRELAEALAKMEPDVLEVRNELVVAESPETLPDSSPSDRP